MLKQKKEGYKMGHCNSSQSLGAEQSILLRLGRKPLPQASSQGEGKEGCQEKGS